MRTLPVITNDEEAARLLERALLGLLVPEGCTLELKGWPTVEIKLTGSIYHGTITAATAKALIEMQQAVDRAYLRLMRPNATRLNAEERRKTAITAKVQPGSSLITVDLSAPLSQLVTELTAKMSPENIIITVLGLGLIGGATVVAKHYIKTRAEQASKANELAAQVVMSQEETKRLAVVTQAMGQRPDLARAMDDFNDARDAVLRSAVNAVSLNLDGVALTGNQARQLYREPRSASEEVRLDGVYLIGAVSWPAGADEVILDLRAMDKTLEFRASLNTRSLLAQDRDLLAAAEWERTPIYLSINAKMLRGQVTKAVIVGFDWEALRQKA
ncbi:hypothetical protein EBQ34_00550 [Vandammella animalimorsus]|uniref:Uncharacterized protein n=1 Tax=Vandammella animalimorsus TaxID=2029117 RepID=A0A3M6RU89_9BURK|nr:hypothetical protein [Vandammella animalimorsus]RMX18886.1 hypothetical protein EBQ34_00550 [Vandammella animalimorsus]